MRDTPVVLLGVTVVGLVATFGMNFTVLIPPLAANVLSSDAAGLRLPHDRVRSWRAGGRGRARHRRPTASGPHRRRAPSCSASRPSRSRYHVVPAGTRADDPDRCRRYHDGGDGERHDPAGRADGLRGRVMSVYTTVFSRLDPDRRPRRGRGRFGGRHPDDRRDRWVPVAGRGSRCLRVVAQARSPSPSAATARRVRPRRSPRSPPPSGLAGGAAARRRPRRPQSTAPNTSAAFRPPNPNEVLSTRR